MLRNHDRGPDRRQFFYIELQCIQAAARGHVEKIVAGKRTGMRDRQTSRGGDLALKRGDLEPSRAAVVPGEVQKSGAIEKLRSHDQTRGGSRRQTTFLQYLDG